MMSHFNTLPFPLLCASNGIEACWFICHSLNSTAHIKLKSITTHVTWQTTTTTTHYTSILDNTTTGTLPRELTLTAFSSFICSSFRSNLHAPGFMLILVAAVTGFITGALGLAGFLTSQLYRRLTTMPVPTVRTMDNREYHKNDTRYRTNANSSGLERDKN